MTYEEILSAALALDAEQRADLAELLWITVDRTDEVAESWLMEAERRGDCVDAGQEQAIPAEQILAELRGRYPAR